MSAASRQPSARAALNDQLTELLVRIAQLDAVEASIRSSVDG